MNARGNLRLLVGVAIALLAGAAQATAQPSRKDMLDAFNELYAQANSAYTRTSFREYVITKKDGVKAAVLLNTDSSREGITKFKGVDIKNQPASGKVKQMIKTWAVPVIDGEETDKKVNLDKYKWRPSERFHLYFQTAVPINVTIYQDYSHKASELRFPDPNFPKTQEIVRAGKPFQYPVRIVLDDTAEDELMTIVVTTAGSHDLPSLSAESAKLSEAEFLVFSTNFTNKLKKKANEAIVLTKFRPDRDDRPEVTTGSPETVASFEYGTDSTGKFQLRLQKRR